MSWLAKIAIVTVFYSLCGAGVFWVASGPQGKFSEPRKANAIPVKNHLVVRRVWIVAARL